MVKSGAGCPGVAANATAAEKAIAAAKAARRTGLCMVGSSVSNKDILKRGERVVDETRLKHLRQQQRRLARAIEHIHRNTVAAERRQRLRDLGIAARPVGP